jgi:hypothetical protein
MVQTTPFSKNHLPPSIEAGVRRLGYLRHIFKKMFKEMESIRNLPSPQKEEQLGKMNLEERGQQTQQIKEEIHFLKNWLIEKQFVKAFVENGITEEFVYKPFIIKYKESNAPSNTEEGINALTYTKQVLQLTDKALLILRATVNQIKNERTDPRKVYDLLKSLLISKKTDAGLQSKFLKSWLQKQRGLEDFSVNGLTNPTEIIKSLTRIISRIMDEDKVKLQDKEFQVFCAVRDVYGY